MKIILPLMLLVLLAGCVATPPDHYWPSSLPDQQHYLDYYAADPNNQQAMTEVEYLRWIKRFYLGWELYARGWYKATEELLESLSDPTDKATAQQQMDDIGLLVSAEWAKEDPHRVINTRHISIWGNALQRATIDSTQFVILESIRADVEALLARQLDPKAIVTQRYYEEAPFEGSGNF